MAEGEIEAGGAGDLVDARLERQDAVMIEPRRAAPHDHIAVAKRHAPRALGALDSAELKSRRQADRHRYDRMAVVALVSILVKGQPRSRLVAVDQAGVGCESGKTGPFRGR